MDIDPASCFYYGLGLGVFGLFVGWAWRFCWFVLLGPAAAASR